MVSTKKKFSERFQGFTIIFLLCVFLSVSVPRFLSLEAHWNSTEALWLKRSEAFMSAIEKANFSETFITHHPGVMTMWIAGIRVFFLDIQEDFKNLALSRFFIGIVVWTSIGLACLLLYRLFGLWVSLASFASLAYSPLFLAQTRRVHTDALASAFILLTVLLFLLYCQKRNRRRYLIFSGMAYGLALLAKSYSLILLPWIPMCLFLFRGQPAPTWGKTILIAILCFSSTVLLTVMFAWPLFWAPVFAILGVCLLGCLTSMFKSLKEEKPSLKRLPFFASAIVLCAASIRTLPNLWEVFNKVGWAVRTPHEVEHFFLGKVVSDPGWLFYPFVLTLKSTPLMLPLSVLGCILLWKQRKHSEVTARQFKMGLAIVIGVVLFTVCLSATSKKFSRYLLPAFLLLEILAAIGFVAGLKWSYAGLQSRFGMEATAKYKTLLATLACVGFFFIQVFPVLALHPYYGTYYNLCWKGTDITKIITVGDASGLDIAAKYLNKIELDRPLRVQVSPLSAQFFIRYFNGLVRTPDRTGGPSPDYEVVYIRDAQIGLVPQTGTLNGELEAVITLNGIDHVWIYRNLPQQE